MIIPEGYEILSNASLWALDENLKPVELKFTYDSLDVVRVWTGEKKTVDHYIDYPIEESILYIPILGAVFFKTRSDAERFATNFNNTSGVITLIENSFEKSRHNKHIVEFDEYNKVPDGLYSISSFDDELPNNVWLNEIRYLNEEGNVKRIKENDENTDFYLSKYLHMVDIETRHDLSHERLIFEFYSECGKVYVNHFFVNCSDEPESLFYYSRISNYPLFGSKDKAIKYRHRINNNEINKASLLMSSQDTLKHRRDIENKKIMMAEMRRKIFEHIIEYVKSQIDPAKIVGAIKNKIGNRKGSK
jgi:hypothetical protein